MGFSFGPGFESPQLHFVMLNRTEILSTLKELKPFLQKEYAVKKIGIFGSLANESFTEESDIDLLVEFEKPIGWKFFSLELYLENILGRKIDLVTKNALKKQIRDKILKDVKFV